MVWFKRDLRTRDHSPRLEAAKGGPVLPLYIVEPSLLRAEDFSSRHWTFLQATLIELRENLTRLGQPLIVRVGEAVEILRNLREQRRFQRIRSQEETGNALTYARDRAVAKWARAENREWVEVPGSGVVRRLRTRDGWSKIWKKRMSSKVLDAPERLLPVSVEPGPIPTGLELGLAPDRRSLIESAGEAAGWSSLESFLTQRGERYFTAMSSPISVFPPE